MLAFTGPDISSHQHDAGVPLDFNAVRITGGHSFVIIKATQNNDYVNPFFKQDVIDAQNAGLVAMPYHYMGPAAAKEQTDWFLSVIGASFSKGPIWLDYEEHSTHAILHEMNMLLDPTPFHPGIYTYPYWWRNNGDPNCRLCGNHLLWYADYNRPATAAAPAPWTSVALRQTHGTSYFVPGLPGLNDMSHGEIDPAIILGSTYPTNPIPPITPEDGMARLISEDGHLAYGTDGAGHVWHVPSMSLENALIAAGIYGDGKVHPVPVGSIKTMQLVSGP